MTKEELLLCLNKEAKRIIKKRITIIRLVINCVLFLVLWCFNPFGLFTNFGIQHVLFILVLILSSIFVPWKVTKDNLRLTFRKVLNKRAQECNNELGNVALTIPRDDEKLTELKEKNFLFLELLLESLANNFK